MMRGPHPTLDQVTERITTRSAVSRRAYLDHIEEAASRGSARKSLSCGNLAHGFAGSPEDRASIKQGDAMNIGIITSFNEMLSAHAPYRNYPDLIKVFAREVGATAQVASGVPAMCDGVTQGQDGMELSLFSRDTIALSTAVGLSHAMFEGVLLLGICDKIVPGLLMGALRFGHLPTILVPGGPMPTGLSHKEKLKVRQRHAQGQASDEALLEAEAATYHTVGTCTFYGTANSNQMMMEAMGLHVPCSSFAPPKTRLRQELTRAAVHRIASIGRDGPDYRPLGRCVDEKAIVNAIVILLATGGSTNHTIHLPAIARCAGIEINWDDFSDLSAVVPLLARIYPNGSDDVNGFQAAGGPGFIIGQLLDGGLLHEDVLTVSPEGMRGYAVEAVLEDDVLRWNPAGESRSLAVARPIDSPFQNEGGLKVLSGNLGRSIMKTSSVDEEFWTTEADALVFDHQDDALAALTGSAFGGDAIVVVRFQGPQANGMPELHKLTPILGALQDRGHRVALVTDGRMSGASGKVPAAIHVTPEAAAGGPLARVRVGDRIRVCARTGTLEVLDSQGDFESRTPDEAQLSHAGCGRELFGLFRKASPSPESGASPLLDW